ncbi:putative HTH-type transcriptional regulator YgzD [Candidatus Levyibacteriota bacterium]|nr:putative HTH-type transcriptional regulator YgzD [Candidatus Levybacteria bacterium]
MSQIVTNTVQEYRSKNKTTQEELGQAVGVTRQTIIAIEKGNYTPSVLLALKIAKYFNTTVEKLFTMDFHNI